MMPLTPKQRRVLDVLVKWIRDHGVPPTHAELCEVLGVSSLSTVNGHLNTLEEKGYLTRHWNRARAITLTLCAEDPIAIARRIIDMVVQEYGSEVFLGDGYAPDDTLLHGIKRAIWAERERLT